MLGETLTETGYDGVVTTTVVSGRKRKVINGEGNTFTYESDELGRLIKVTQPKVSGTAPVMSYTYDLADNLLTATGPNNAVTTIEYDKLGRKTEMRDADMGKWTYAYDPSGNLLRQTDAKTQRLCFYYDGANRLTNKRHDGTGTGNCPPTPGGTTRLATYTYHTSGAGMGLPSQIQGGSGDGAFTDTFAYDFRGRTTIHTRVVGGRSWVKSTTYDEVDRPLTMTPTGQTVTYTYDGEFPKTLDVGGQGRMVDDLDYNYRRQLTRIERTCSAPDTTLAYYDQTDSFRLDEITTPTPTIWATWPPSVGRAGRSSPAH
ncbi:MAG: RHS repeat domain-containing protein [Chloroflexota bacterium]